MQHAMETAHQVRRLPINAVRKSDIVQPDEGQ